MTFSKAKQSSTPLAALIRHWMQRQTPRKNLGFFGGVRRGKVMDDASPASEPEAPTAPVHTARLAIPKGNTTERKERASCRPVRKEGANGDARSGRLVRDKSFARTKVIEMHDAPSAGRHVPLALSVFLAIASATAVTFLPATETDLRTRERIVATTSRNPDRASATGTSFAGDLSDARFAGRQTAR